MVWRNMNVPKGFKTAKEAAKMIGIDYQTLMRWRRIGKIKTWKPAKEVFVSQKEIDRFLVPPRFENLEFNGKIKL